MIRTSKWLLNILTRGKAHAITIFPFIFLINDQLKSNTVLINHEKIHIRQQLELLVLPFYLLYFIEYAYGRLRNMSHNEAYRNISFEKEAYDRQEDMNYLKNRSFWSFRHYYKK